MQILYTSLAIPIVLITAWLWVVMGINSRFPKIRNKRICLLIAHPDDEAMFFAPTVLALTDPSLGNHVKILCLSSGDADGLGETRKKELAKSGMHLGLRTEDDVFVVDSPDFPDSMTTTWPAPAISALLTSAFAPSLASSSSSSKNSTSTPATATIDILLTFDAHGVSSHPNHISLYHGARAFISSLSSPSTTVKCSPVDLYTITSTNIVRKYSSILDVTTSLLLMVLEKLGENLRGNLQGAKGTTKGRAQERWEKEHPSRLLFASGPGEVRRAQEAMTRAHVSQMRWFRWGWIGLSRYMVVSDLKLEKIA